MKTLQMAGPVEDLSPLHLPVRALFGDLDVGSGSVSLPDEFTKIPPSLQAEMLQDWIHGLEQARRRALVQIYRDMSMHWQGLPAAERVAAFRSTCAQAGLELPPDLAIMLQHERGTKS
jgi:hypothetical protein